MEKYSKIGLPALIGALVIFVFAIKTFVNIGYGEAGVLFKTFGNGVVTDEPPLGEGLNIVCLLYTSPSPRDRQKSRMPSSA